MIYSEFFDDKADRIDELTRVYNRDVIFSYVELLISKNGKRLVEHNGKPIFKYVSDNFIKENFVPVDGDYKHLKRKNNQLILIQVPQTIKVPMDVYSRKNFLIEKGRWIDITDINNLKFCSNREFNMLYEVI